MKIQLNNLTKIYQTQNAEQKIHAVNGISLTIPSNCIFGIIGKSGAGKSTLVRLISLLEKCDSGQIFYDDEQVENLPLNKLIERRRKIGMIFQNFNLFSSRSAGQNIAYPLEIAGVQKSIIKKRVEELLELVDLRDRKDAPVSTLSGGQKQRIAIARSLANNPDILFCDEATSALDPQTTQSILNLIRQIQAQMNLTVVMITHQMEVVRDACSLVAVVDNGKVVEEGNVNDIFLHPKANITKEFLLKLAPSHESTTSEPKSEQPNIVRWSETGGKYVLRFTNTLTDEPVLSRMAQKFNIEFNIRAGGIQTLSENKVGTLITDISGSKEELSKALAYLRESGVIVEEEA
ncbi:MAG: methionine ABC transporter ATP-binding protein [Treponema sp.]|nr:methionine ABC transporter ATP-binding protein [Treponema sp.]